MSVHTQPGARKSTVAGLHGEALTAFVAKALGVPRRAVSIVKGKSSRETLLVVADTAADPARLLPGES